jgi:hypothetical protein
VSRGELPLELGDGLQEGIEPRLQGVDLSLQPLAVGARRCRLGGHEGQIYAARAGDSTLGTVTNILCTVDLARTTISYRTE